MHHYYFSYDQISRASAVSERFYLDYLTFHLYWAFLYTRSLDSLRSDLLKTFFYKFINSFVKFTTAKACLLYHIKAHHIHSYFWHLENICSVCFVVLFLTGRDGEKIRMGGLVLNKSKKLNGLRFTLSFESIVYAKQTGLGVIA